MANALRCFSGRALCKARTRTRRPLSQRAHWHAARTDARRACGAERAGSEAGGGGGAGRHGHVQRAKCAAASVRSRGAAVRACVCSSVPHAAPQRRPPRARGPVEPSSGAARAGDAAAAGVADAAALSSGARSGACAGVGTCVGTMARCVADRALALMRCGTQGRRRCSARGGACTPPPPPRVPMPRLANRPRQRRPASCCMHRRRWLPPTRVLLPYHPQLSCPRLPCPMRPPSRGTWQGQARPRVRTRDGSSRRSRSATTAAWWQRRKQWRQRIRSHEPLRWQACRCRPRRRMLIWPLLPWTRRRGLWRVPLRTSTSGNASGWRRSVEMRCGRRSARW